MIRSTLILATLLLFSLQTRAAITQPDPDLTPGKTCTAKDPYFQGYDYPTNVARCTRHVTKAEKIKVAEAYGGIDQSDWPSYEFDHLIPLCAGGSNDIKNLWPQPIDEAKDKDKIEDEVCAGLRSGDLTQKEAIQKVWDWFNERAQGKIKN